MSSMRIEFNSAGFREILTGGGVKSLVESQGNAIAARAGEGFEAGVFLGNYGGGRWICTVRAATKEARKAESENKVLSRAVY